MGASQWLAPPTVAVHGRLASAFGSAPSAFLLGEPALYKLCFYVPKSHLHQVKQALFDAGAGCIGDYDSCCWQCLGEGQFRPRIGANPFIGVTGQLERVPEWKVEMVLDDDCVQAAVSALKASHPYETPAYQIWKLEAMQ